MNHEHSAKCEHQLNTHFIWHFFILLILPYFLFYIIIQLLSLKGITTGNLPTILLKYGILTLCLTFLGTSLPASVAERGEGLTAAMRRGYRTCRWLAPRLMIGPAAIFTLPMISPIFDTYAGLKGLLIDPSQSTPDIPLWLAVLSLALPPVATIKAFVLLAVAYRRGEDVEAPVAETETAALTEEPRAG